MPPLHLPAKTRRFLPYSLVPGRWEQVEPYFIDLLSRQLVQPGEIERFLSDRSELASALEEEQAWRYIKMNCNTEDQSLAAAYEQFVREIVPEAEKYSHLLDQKLVETGALENLPQDQFFVLIRSIKQRMEIFREENLPLLADLQVMEQEYGVISGRLSVHFRDRELTLQQASNYLRDTYRATRESVFRLILEARLSVVEPLHRIFDRLVGKRMQVATIAGFHSYREYKFADLGRFDYGINDCLEFHTSIKKCVRPLVEHIHQERKKKMGLGVLKPWDLEVDPLGRPDLKPFTDAHDLMTKAVLCFHEVRPGYGDYLDLMHRNGFMDLDSRLGKAPGGFNYPLYESNVPFIFMNSAGSLRDLETLMHEGGHALHSFLSACLPLVDFKSLPAEVAELGSMSMELICMEHWHHFFPDPVDLARAKRNQLEGVISVLPWIACVDSFQHWIYTHPGHTHRERDLAWIHISREQLSSLVDYTGVEEAFTFAWQKQLHIFELPFYYIEYAIAQLGAIAIWRNYRKDPVQTLDRFENALKLGYSVTIPQVYLTAGIEFNFSEENIRELMDFVWDQLNDL